MTAWPDRSVEDRTTELRQRPGESSTPGSTPGAGATLTLLPGGTSTGDAVPTETGSGSSRPTLLVVAPAAVPTSTLTKDGRSHGVRSAGLGHACLRCPTLLYDNKKLCNECRGSTLPEWKAKLDALSRTCSKCGCEKPPTQKGKPRLCQDCYDEQIWFTERKRVASYVTRRRPCKRCKRPKEPGARRQLCNRCRNRVEIKTCAKKECERPRAGGVNSYCVECKQEAREKRKKRETASKRKLLQNDPERRKKKQEAHKRWAAKKEREEQENRRRERQKILPANQLRLACIRAAALREVTFTQLITDIEAADSVRRWDENKRVSLLVADHILTALDLFWWEVWPEPVPPAERGPARDVQAYMRACDDHLTARAVFERERPCR